jgi:hypothetical protein
MKQVQKRLRHLIWLPLIALLIACGAQETPALTENAVVAATQPATATLPPPPSPTPLIMPTTVVQTTDAEPQSAESTATAIPTAAPMSEPELTYGITADGNYFIGFPDAPVTLLDYSDFL